MKKLWVLLPALLLCLIMARAEEAPRKLAGLDWQSLLPLTYAEGFTVDTYSGGCRLITIAGEGRFLTVPEGQPEPEGLDPDIVVLREPMDRIYLAATSAMALFDRLDALDTLSFSSQKPEGWRVENAVKAMQEGRLTYAGKYSQPDYELLLGSGCRLAIESTMIYHAPKVREMLEQLGIPVLVDRSSYESHPLGRTEWIKLYGALTGRLEAAEEFFEERARAVQAFADPPAERKKVAFFYINSNGAAVVRNPSDYVPKMIRLAGGEYVPAEIPGQEGGSSATIDMESFCMAARDADYLIYYTSIASPLDAPGDLAALCPLMAEFRAVRQGNVYQTGKDLYQASDDVSDFIVDLHSMLTGQGEMRFLEKVGGGSAE